VQAVGPVSTDYLDLERWAIETPAASALAAPDRPLLAYSALWQHVRLTSAALHDAGVRPGGVVALAFRNGPEFLTAVLAITLRSACAPIELDLTLDECRSKLERIKASTLLVEDGVPSPAAGVARDLGMRVVHVSCSPHAPAGIFSVANVEAPSAADYQGRQTDAALILMTSATTDLPKMVPRSRIALRTAALYNVEAFQLTAADRYLCCMPLIHSHGIGEAMAQLAAGGALFCMPAFDAERFCSWLDRFGPTWFSASPTMHRIILTLARETPEVFKRVPLRLVRSSAAAPDPDVITELETRLGVPILNGYGMTEVASATRNTPCSRKHGSVGRSCGVDVAIMDDSGNLLPSEMEGEVAFRGPTVMSGYLDNPEANQAAFRDGWFRTGDLGKLDSEGFLFLLGRRKETINRGGKKISPLEVDLALAKHPDVSEVATFAIEHRTLGEDVAAAVVLRLGAEVSELDLRQFAARQLSAYKIPRRIVFVEAIPRTRVGKPRRAALTEHFRDLAAPLSMRRTIAQVQRALTEIETQLVEIWRRILALEQIGVDDNFFDLGGDSLSAALMLSQVEKVHAAADCPLDASDFYDQPTVAVLAAIIEASMDEKTRLGPRRVLLLHKAGSRIPFFCFSSGGIDRYQLRHLSRELGPDQPFIDLGPPSAAQDQRLLRASEIARQSIESIRALRKHGPYLLGGYCYGGVLAFETARQLTEEGEEVALLALFDTPTPGYPKIVRARWRYARHASGILRDLARGRSSIRPRDIAEHLRALWRITSRRWSARATRVIAAAGMNDSQPEKWNGVVMREYAPRPIRARIVQFLADNVPVSAAVLQDRRLGWQDFARGGFETIHVPGDHVSMLAEANVAALAAELEEVLRAAIVPEAVAELRRVSS
jgi:acyl-CoA synthetase (AMP-forming)/AMP-acid ligase II/thioesterase domain-containing protein